MADGSMTSEVHWLTDRQEWCSLGEYVLFLKQRKAYEFASSYCEGKDVLDFGHGGGYGTRLLAEKARSVVGVDVDSTAVDYANSRYRADNLTFQLIPGDSPLPFETGSFDMVVSFQVIEHVPDVRAYLRELRRVLREGGKLLLTTPNRRYRLLPFQKPWNPDHLREYSARQLRREIARVFATVQVMGVHGSAEVDAIERARVRQRPIDVYLRRPAVRTLRALLPQSLFSALRRARPSTQPALPSATPVEVGRFDLLSFYVAEDTDSGLDLLAVCMV